MNIAVINNSLLDKIDKEIFSYEDVIIYLNDLISFLGIEDYIKNIIFLESDKRIKYNPKDKNVITVNNNYHNIKLDEQFLSTYNFYNKLIKVKISTIINDAKNIYTVKNNKILILYINLMILNAMLHEITHAYQNFVINEIELEDNNIYKLIELELNLVNTLNNVTYNKYYFAFTFEREAMFNALENIILIIKNMINNEELLTFFENHLNFYLLNGYKVEGKKISSPLEIIYKKLLKQETPETTHIDTYTALKYGLPISIDEYNSFRKERRL